MIQCTTLRVFFSNLQEPTSILMQSYLIGSKAAALVTHGYQSVSEFVI